MGKLYVSAVRVAGSPLARRSLTPGMMEPGRLGRKLLTHCSIRRTEKCITATIVFSLMLVSVEVPVSC
jgi:hypothetical protein